jgi:hypothetical protein
MRFLLALVVSLVVCGLVHAQNDGMPFGPIGEADVDRLEEFAKASGFDWKPEMERVYKKDKEALARLFTFSLVFKTLDSNARAYGQVIYSSWLNLGEQYGLDFYLEVLDQEPADVQQRVRDFLYYPMLRVPKEHRKEAEEEIRKQIPRLFPQSFQFGRNDPVFATKT